MTAPYQLTLRALQHGHESFVQFDKTFAVCSIKIESWQLHSLSWPWHNLAGVPAAWKSNQVVQPQIGASATVCPAVAAPAMICEDKDVCGLANSLSGMTSSKDPFECRETHHIPSYNAENPIW